MKILISILLYQASFVVSVIYAKYAKLSIKTCCFCFLYLLNNPIFYFWISREFTCYIVGTNGICYENGSSEMCTTIDKFIPALKTTTIENNETAFCLVLYCSTLYCSFWTSFVKWYRSNLSYIRAIHFSGFLSRPLRKALLILILFLIGKIDAQNVIRRCFKITKLIPFSAKLLQICFSWRIT